MSSIFYFFFIFLNFVAFSNRLCYRFPHEYGAVIAQNFRSGRGYQSLCAASHDLGSFFQDFRRRSDFRRHHRPHSLPNFWVFVNSEPASISPRSKVHCAPDGFRGVYFADFAPVYGSGQQYFADIFVGGYFYSSRRVPGRSAHQSGLEGVLAAAVDAFDDEWDYRHGLQLPRFLPADHALWVVQSPKPAQHLKCFDIRGTLQFLRSSSGSHHGIDIADIDVCHSGGQGLPRYQVVGFLSLLSVASGSLVYFEVFLPALSPCPVNFLF